MKAYNIIRTNNKSFIKGLVSTGRIAVSEDATKEFNQELETDEMTGDEFLEEDFNEDNFEEVEKIHTIDTVSQVTNKFDKYMSEVDIDWTPFISNGKIRKATNFKYIEDMRVLLNKTFDKKDFRYVQVFNNLYDYLTDPGMSRDWNIFSRENFGKPYITEGVALLMYELAVEWVPVITRFYKESPVFNKDAAPEEDSFFKKFPNLNDLTYIAAIIVENKEFKRLLSSKKSKELLLEEGKYILTATQAKKKPQFTSMGESLSYYAGLVKENFGDITVGILDKLGVVVFLHNNNKTPMNDRLALIERLIRVVTTRTTSPDANGNDPLMSALESLNQSCIDFLKNIADARITLESNEKNYPMFITNNGV